MREKLKKKVETIEKHLANKRPEKDLFAEINKWYEYYKAVGTDERMKPYEDVIKQVAVANQTAL